VPEVKYASHVEKVRRTVLESPGRTPPALRRAVFDGRLPDLPEALRDYVSKVRGHAHEITDADVDALKRAGYTEDEVFEITASAALGAGMLRMERALGVLRESGA
jgi:alkylhydroperoxidase family enzyme